MMFYAVDFCPDGLARVGLLQQRRDSRAGSPIAQPAEHQIEAGTPDQKVADLPQQVGATVLIEGHVLYIRQPNASLVQAIGDGMDGKPSPMLDTAKSLLLSGCNQFSVPHQRSRRIAMKSVQTQNDHRAAISLEFQQAVSTFTLNVSETAPERTERRDHATFFPEP